MLLIFYAFERELAPFMRMLDSLSPVRIQNFTGYLGKHRESELTLAPTGLGMNRARNIAELALDILPEPSLVISTGVAGALCEELDTGSLILADRLLLSNGSDFASDRSVEISRAWLEDSDHVLQTAGLPFATGALLTSSHVLPTGLDKRRAHCKSGAIAVDMESAAIGAIVTARSIPFICVRAILDSVDDELPAIRLADESGRVKPLAVASYLIKNPAAGQRLVRMKHKLARASASLASALSALCHNPHSHC